MAFIRTLRGPARGRSAGFVPSSLACAARRVTLSTGVRLVEKASPSVVPGVAADKSRHRPAAPADSRP